MNIRKTLRDSTMIFVLVLVSTTLGYLLRLYLSGNMTIEEFGLFYAVNAFVSLFITFQEFGAGITAISKFVPGLLASGKKGRIKTTIMVVALFQPAIAIIFIAVVFLFSGQISLLVFGNPEAAPVMMVLMASLFFISIFRVFQFTFQGFQKMTIFSLVDTTKIAFTFLIAVVLIQFGAVGVAFAYLASAIILCIVFFPPFMKIMASLPPVKKSIVAETFREVSGFSNRLFIGVIALFSILNMDTIILTILTNLENVGLYQAAFPTAQFLWIFPMAITVVIFPLASGLYASKKLPALGNMTSLFSLLSFFVTMPFAIIILSFPDIILATLFGYTYIPAAGALRILGIGSIAYSLFYIFYYILSAIGKPAIGTMVIFKMAAINLVLNLLLIPNFGITGAAIASTIAFLSGMLMAYLSLNKFVPIRLPFIKMAKIFVSAIVSVAAISLIKDILVIENAWIEAAIALLIGFIVYASLIFITGAITRKDINYIKSIVR